MEKKNEKSGKDGKVENVFTSWDVSLHVDKCIDIILV